MLCPVKVRRKKFRIDRCHPVDSLFYFIVDKNVETDMYSFHGPVVERQRSIRGARVQSQTKTLYLNLGSLHDKMKMRAVKISGS